MVKVTVENKDYMRAMQELRRSSASSKHTPKPKKGTRKVKQDRAIKEQLDG